MKIRNLINKLEKLEEKHGNVDVMMHASDGPYEINSVHFHVTEEGDYPDDYMMDAGFKFVELVN